MTTISMARRALLVAVIMVTSVALAMIATGWSGMGSMGGRPQASISLNGATRGPSPDSISLN